MNQFNINLQRKKNLQEKLETCLTCNNKKVIEEIYTVQCDKFKIYQAKIYYKVQTHQFSISIQFVKTSSIFCSKVLLDSKLVRFHTLFLICLDNLVAAVMNKLPQAT